MARLKKTGEVTVLATSQRDLGWAGAPCEGYMRYEEHGNPDGHKGVPTIFSLVERALGDQPEFGSTVLLTVTVKVTKAERRSPRKCHNPWPAHSCNIKKRKRKP